MSEIRSLRRLVNTAHRQIAELSLLGESVAGWEDPDYALYQGKTAVLDSIILMVLNIFFIINMCFIIL